LSTITTIITLSVRSDLRLLQMNCM